MGRRLVAVLLAVLVARDFANRRGLVNLSGSKQILLHSDGISSIEANSEHGLPNNNSDNEIGLNLTRNAKIEVIEQSRKQLQAELLRAVVERSVQSDRPCASHGSPESGCDRWISGWTLSLFPQHLRFIMVFKTSARDCVDVANKAKAAYDATNLEDFDKVKKKCLNDILDVAGGFPQTPTEDEIYADDWVALVQREDSSSIVAYFRGNTGVNFVGSYIAQVESNSKSEHHIEGATSWGLSMLLHRLRLRSHARARLHDLSGHKKDGMVQLRGTNTFVTKGSLVYGGMMKEKRPYTFNTDKNNVTYDYDLDSEGYGAEYGSDEPC